MFYLPYSNQGGTESSFSKNSIFVSNYLHQSVYVGYHNEWPCTNVLEFKFATERQVIGSYHVSGRFLGDSGWFVVGSWWVLIRAGRFTFSNLRFLMLRKEKGFSFLSEISSYSATSKKTDENAQIASANVLNKLRTINNFSKSRWGWTPSLESAKLSFSVRQKLPRIKTILFFEGKDFSFFSVRNMLPKLIDLFIDLSLSPLIFRCRYHRASL